MFELRPRQKKLKSDVRKACAAGAKRILIVAPPGFGKTPTAVSIMNDAVEKGKKILFLVHRKELIEQCSATLDKFLVPHSILINKHPKCNLSMPVQLSSWQTMKRFINSDHTITVFVPDIIIYDEAHRSVAEVALNVLTCFPNVFLFGFTGTPYRDDGKGLGQKDRRYSGEPIYQALVSTCTTPELISEGLIVKPEYYQCREDTDIDAYLKQIDQAEVSADFAQNSACSVIKGDVIRNFKKICPDSQAVVFCPNTEQAEIIAESFRKSGITANMVECNTKNRKQLLSDFSSKKFQIITNASLLSEGWDYPSLECVINLRNVQSRVFYRQASNRCMRIAKGKNKAYVLDFFNLPDKFLDLPWSDEGEYSLDPDTEILPRKNREKRDGIEITFVKCNECPNTIDLTCETHCSACGALAPERMQKIVVEAVNDLDKVDEDEIEKKKATKDEKQVEFDKLVAICMNKGWKPGWVGNKYKEKFGCWPKSLKYSEAWLKYKEEFSQGKEEKQVSFSLDN